MTQKKIKKEVESKYSKKQLMSSQKYRHDLDKLSVLLDDTKTYSISEVDTMITKLLNKQVGGK